MKSPIRGSVVFYGDLSREWRRGLAMELDGSSLESVWIYAVFLNTWMTIAS